MLVKVQNPDMAGEGISANSNSYFCDHRGVAAVQPADAEVLIAIAGFKKLGEIGDDEALKSASMRMPETRAEFMAMCRKCGMTGDDLRAMANALDSSMGILPQEGEAPDVDPGGGGSGQIAEPKATIPDPDPQEWARLQRGRRSASSTDEEVTQ